MIRGMISVIIPCYNLRECLNKCIGSLLNQTYRNLEIITVDDGSFDGTSEILQNYAKEDKRIIYIRQQNAGAGVAINKGIEMAKGEFLAFVDNDDWVEPQMYEKLYLSLNEHNADMAVCNFNLIYKDRIEKCYSNSNSVDEAVDIRKDIFAYFCRYCACPKPNNYTWSRLYKAEIIKNSKVRFENFRLGADTLFNYKLLPLMRRVVFLKDGLYNYVQREDSSVYTMGKKYNIAEIYADGFEALADYYLNEGYKEFCCVLQIHAFTRMRSIFFYSRLAGLSEEEIEENIKKGFKERKIAKYLTGAME